MRHMGYAIAAVVLLGAGGGVVLADYMYSGDAAVESDVRTSLEAGDADAKCGAPMNWRREIKRTSVKCPRRVRRRRAMTAIALSQLATL